MKKAPRPTVSIVVNTNGRRDSLSRTLESFQHLDYDRFEVCVVYGPAQDGTAELLQAQADRIKLAYCPQQNLSVSRNMGIELAAGELVAFIDDDGIPEAEWLSGVSAPFADPAVGACGGLIYDQTGYEAQHRFVTCDRLGRAHHNHGGPATDRNYPFSFEYPAVTGTNSVFRRTALVEIGGFDEEYDYFLDETDVCCRLVDRGWRIVQLPDAPVHHKFLPSSIRTTHRVTNPYPLIKNKVYFSLVHALPFRSMEQVLEDCTDFSRERRREHEHHLSRGHINADAMDQFDLDAAAAWRDGLLRGLSGDRRRRSAASLAPRIPFNEFTPFRAKNGRRVLVFLSQDYPPGPMSGVSRYTHDVGRALARLGHTVHVLTRGTELNTVDLEEGVWVHRLLPLLATPEPEPAGEGTVDVPSRILELTAAYAREIKRIGQFRQVDVVEAPSWDAEGLGILLERSVPLVVNVVTTLATYLEAHPELAEDRRWMADYGRPLLTLEKRIFQEADGVIAASRAIIGSTRSQYGVTIDPERISYVPHLSNNLAVLPRARPSGLPCEPGPGRIPVLFVGRLEARKGIDVLLAAAVTALQRNRQLEFWIAGDDTYLLSRGRSAGEIFLAKAPQEVRDSVRFLGRVDDDGLNWLLANCGIVVIPSRFESFGLVSIEAMMFGKPVVASDAGGLAELVRPDHNGLLTPVGDADALAAALLRLAGDAALRRSLGENGLALYREKYDPDRLVHDRFDALAGHFRSSLGPERLSVPTSAGEVRLPHGRRGWHITDHQPISFEARTPRVWVTVWSHEWSGFLEVRLEGILVDEIDLFAPAEGPRTFCIRVPRPGLVKLYGSSKRNPRARGNQVIVMDIKVPERAIGPDIQGEEAA